MTMCHMLVATGTLSLSHSSTPCRECTGETCGRHSGHQPRGRRSREHGHNSFRCVTLFFEYVKPNEARGWLLYHSPASEPSPHRFPRIRFRISCRTTKQSARQNEAALPTHPEAQSSVTGRAGDYIHAQRHKTSMEPAGRVGTRRTSALCWRTLPAGWGLPGIPSQSRPGPHCARDCNQCENSETRGASVRAAHFVSTAHAVGWVVQVLVPSFFTARALAHAALPAKARMANACQ